MNHWQKKMKMVKEVRKHNERIRTNQRYNKRFVKKQIRKMEA